MNRRRIVKIGIIGLAALVLVAGGVYLAKKGGLFSKADVIPAPTNMTATIAGIADDPIDYRHWAYKYIDGALNYSVPATGEKMMNLYPPESDGSVKFYPNILTSKAQLAVYATKIANIAPCPTCSQSFTDVPKTYWAFGYIEAAYRAGLFRGRPIPGTSAVYYLAYGNTFMPEWGTDSTDPLTGFALTTVLLNAGKTYTYPAGGGNDNSPLSRAIIAGLISKNLSLPSTSKTSSDIAGIPSGSSETQILGTSDPQPELFFQWDFPDSAEAGFDFGFELWRQKAGEAEPTLLFTQDPPEEGMEVGSDFGLAYDLPGATGSYTYTVLAFNRDGQYSEPISINIDLPAPATVSAAAAVTSVRLPKSGVTVITSPTPSPSPTKTPTPTPTATKTPTPTPTPTSTCRTRGQSCGPTVGKPCCGGTTCRTGVCQ